MTDDYDAILSQVTVPREIAELWEQPLSSVYRWLDEGKIYGVQIYGTWVVSLDSVLAFLGPPVGEWEKFAGQGWDTINVP